DGPAPLDESSAKYMLSMVSRFFQSPSGSAPSSSSSSSPSSSAIPSTITMESLTIEVHRSAGRVLFFLSLYNWPIVFNRIVSRIRALSSSSSSSNNPSSSSSAAASAINSSSMNSSEDGSDLGDLRLLEWCKLTGPRLSAIFQELISNFLQMRKDAQVLMPVILRQAIWNWIELSQDEFRSLQRQRRRLDGSPEVLFDMFNRVADSPKKKTVFWPAQAMLLLLCPDIMHNIIVTEVAQSSKRGHFLEILRKQLKASKLSEVSAVAYVDFCKAAAILLDGARSPGPGEDNGVEASLRADELFTSSGLLTMIPEITHELRERLFDPEKPFLSADLSVSTAGSSGKQRLMTECLTALLRLDRDRDMQALLIPQCLRDGMPPVYRLILVRACYLLAQEPGGKKRVQGMYDMLASPLSSTNSPSSAPNASSSSAVTSSIPSGPSSMAFGMPGSRGGIEREEMVLHILRLYRTDGSLALWQAQGSGEMGRIIRGVTISLRSWISLLRGQASEALLQLYSPKIMQIWAEDDPSPSSSYPGSLGGLWRISSEVILAVARQLLDFRERAEGLRQVLCLLEKLLERRVHFLDQVISSHPTGIHRVLEGMDVPERLRASISLEVALLVLLCSAEPEICSAAVRCFGWLVEEARRRTSMPPPQLTIAENVSVYAEMAKIEPMVNGRVAQQKKLRHMLRLITNSTPGNVAAWVEAYKRWRLQMHAVARPVEESGTMDVMGLDLGTREWHVPTWFSFHLLTLSFSFTPILSFSPLSSHLKKDRGEWHNYTGFLCALGGVCLEEGVTGPSGQSNRYLLERFIGEMVELLVCENVVVREVVQQTLGSDLSPLLYVVLFKQLEGSSSSQSPSSSTRIPVRAERWTLFVEQAISVLRLLLERLQTEALVAIDLGNLILAFARYIDRLGSGASALRIRIKMCQLCEVLMSKRELILIQQEIRFRNRLLRILTQWISDYGNFGLDTGTSFSLGGIHDQVMYHKNEKLHRDLDLACMKTIERILQGLPLQPLDGQFISEPSPGGAGGTTEANLAQAKSQLFYGYFSFFIRLLNRCRVLETMDRTMGRGGASAGARELAQLKVTTIRALSHLLSGNIESGLKYSLVMGYHEDPQTRSAFMQVLTHLLEQGTDFDDLAENVRGERYSKLVDLLMESGMAIALALGEVAGTGEGDEVGGLLLATTEVRNLSLPLLRSVIERELMRTAEWPDLFRGNCLATFMMHAYARLHGSEYLRDTLQPLLQDLVNAPTPFTFELNPLKLTPEDNQAKNMAAVKYTAQNFVDAIINSAPNLPKPIRAVCAFLAEAVGHRFPEHRRTAVGGFLFLRFFSPAIAAPETHHLISAGQKTPETRKGLILITKIMQNLANGVLFGRKESYTKGLNDFLLANSTKVAAFLDEVSRPLEPWEAVDTGLPDMGEEEDGEVASDADSEDVESVGLDKSSGTGSGKGGKNSHKSGHKDGGKGGGVAAALLPNRRNRRNTFLSGAHSSTHSGGANAPYRAFMTKNRHRATDVVAAKQIFYDGGRESREHRPVLYFVARRLNAESTNMEILFLHILKVLEPKLDQPFELVVDLTLFSHSNEIQKQWLEDFSQVLPQIASQNLAVIYFYGASSAFKTYTKVLGPRALPSRLVKRVIFCANLGEMHEYVAPADLRLPRWTMSLETDPGVAFTPVTQINNYKLPVPTTMKVGAEVVQVATMRRHEIFGLSVTLNDVYRLSEMEDIQLLAAPSMSSQEETATVRIKGDRWTSPLTFCSNKAEAICQAIRNAKARLEQAKTPKNVTERTIRPSDVPGTLLNMALLNMGSGDATLRVAAYDLLYALCRTFNFAVGAELMQTDGLCIPANSLGFVRSISEKLAITEGHLTLELLTEAFVGFKQSTASLKCLCLEYMAPWFTALAASSRTTTNRIQEILRQLIELTLKEREMYPIFQTKVWCMVGSVDGMIGKLIEVFVEHATQHGIDSAPAEILANTVVSLPSVNVRGKIVARLRKVIAQTACQPTLSLTEHGSWPEIATLLRFALMLSFDDHLHVPQYLPEICHALALLVSTGSPLIRATVHGLVINLVHGLCTATATLMTTKKVILKDLSSPRFRALFGLNGDVQAFLSTGSATPNVLGRAGMPLASLETMVRLLLDVMIWTISGTEMANAWRARWMSLVTSTAFQFNPALQPRAFVVLGCLARSEVDDDILYQVLVTLKGALCMFNEGNCSLIVSIIMCLAKIAENLPADSRYLLPLFWLAMSFVHIGHVPLFPPALTLMEVVLRNMQSKGFFASASLGSVLLEARKPLEDLLHLKDGIPTTKAFQKHFPFAVAMSLIKGLKHPHTQAATIQALTTFLEIASRSTPEDAGTVDPQVLGFLAPLLPQASKAGELRELFWLVGSSSMSGMTTSLATSYHRIFDRLNIPDRDTALLLIALMVTLLNNAESESDQLFLYGFLAESATALPGVFIHFYDTLLPKMNAVFSSNHSVPILGAVQAIFYTLLAIQREDMDRRNPRILLRELGFEGLAEAGTFDSVTKEQKKAYADLASAAVGRVIG
ncbi:MAG: hypothetical protein DHS80DRAFT_17060, partial [Piptocephalis tieghemiana]